MTGVLPRSDTPRLPPWGAPAGVGAFGAAIVGTVALMDPVRRGALSPGCPFRTLTGLDCPGCGGTRSLYALTQGDLVLAVDHNLLVVLLLPVLVGVWATWFLRRVRDGRLGRAPAPPAAVSMGFAVVIMLFWVARNLPWTPFAWFGSMAGG